MSWKNALKENDLDFPMKISNVKRAADRGSLFGDLSGVCGGHPIHCEFEDKTGINSCTSRYVIF